jgi:hypothetical protein
MTDNSGLFPPGNFPTLGQSHIKLYFAMRQTKKKLCAQNFRIDLENFPDRSSGAR